MDDASEWENVDEYLDQLQRDRKPVTMEEFLEFYDSQVDLYGDADVPVSEVLDRMKAARK